MMRLPLRAALLAALVTTVLFAIRPTTATAHGSLTGEGLRLANGNPIRGDVTFAFRINHEMRSVDLALFDLSGRRVTTVFHGSLGAGEHRIVMAGAGLPVGSYLARLQTDHGVSVKRLVLFH